MIGVECTPTADAMSQRGNWCGFTTALRPEPVCDWGGDSCTVIRVGFMHIVRLNNYDIQDPNGWQ